MPQFRKIACVFPGQGAQYPGMGKDFYLGYSQAKDVFDEADELLGRRLSQLVFEGPEAVLTETKNSQLAIYVVSLAVLKTLQALFPELAPSVCAGLSLGEYTALTAAGRLTFTKGVPLVAQRGAAMHEACEQTRGTMAVVVGLDADTVAEAVKEVNMPEDLWAANFNCPGQVVLSGTLKGIEAGTAAVKGRGAKRVLPLQVFGAFHSGLMQSAQEKLAPALRSVPLHESPCQVVMNVTGKEAGTLEETRENLIQQVTHPVCWEQSVRRMIGQGVDLFVEVGCGKVLAGFHKRIDPAIPFVSIEKVEDLPELERILR